MNILFCAGGTLGHIYPALSIINKIKIKMPSIKIYFICNNKDLSYINSINNNIDYIYTFDAYGICKNPFKLFIRMIKNIKICKNIKNILIKNNINVIVGFGGYISGLTIFAGRNLKIKKVIHEQNSVIGLSNKLALKMVDIFFTTFKMEKYHNNQIVVGNPRYDDLSNIDLNNKNKKHLLITSGTLGSKKINEVVIDFLKDEFSLNYFTTFITGKRYYEDVLKKLIVKHHFEVLPFSNNMIEYYSKCGIVISRSGSTTISEILASKTIPILIPSPNVTNNHQYYNAVKLSKSSIGFTIKEEEFNKEMLIKTLKEINNDYEKYVDNIKNCNLDNNSDLFINHIIKLGKLNE